MQIGEATISITPDLRAMRVLGLAAQAVEVVLDAESVSFTEVEVLFGALKQAQSEPWVTNGDKRHELLRLAAFALGLADELR